MKTSYKFSRRSLSIGETKKIRLTSRKIQVALPQNHRKSMLDLNPTKLHQRINKNLKSQISIFNQESSEDEQNSLSTRKIKNNTNAYNSKNFSKNK